MSRFAAYRVETGRIDHVRESDVSRMRFHHLPDGHLFVEFEDVDVSPETHYVEDAEVVPRTAIVGVSKEYTIAADGVDEVSFTLPEGTIVGFEDVEHAGEEAFRFTSDIAGVYRFSIIPPARFLDMEILIHAV